MSDVKVSNYKNRDELSKISMKVKFPQWATQSGDLLLFKARPDQVAGQVSNPLSRDEAKVSARAGGIAPDVFASGDHASGRFHRTLASQPMPR